MPPKFGGVFLHHNSTACPRRATIYPRTHFPFPFRVLLRNNPPRLVSQVLPNYIQQEALIASPRRRRNFSGVTVTAAAAANEIRAYAVIPRRAAGGGRGEEKGGMLPPQSAAASFLHCPSDCPSVSLDTRRFHNKGSNIFQEC